MTFDLDDIHPSLTIFNINYVNDLSKLRNMVA